MDVGRRTSSRDLGWVWPCDGSGGATRKIPPLAQKIFLDFVCFPEKRLERLCAVKIAEGNCRLKVLSFSAEEVGERENESASLGKVA